jgi:hypothetical protein
MRSIRVRRAHLLLVVETFFEREQESIFELEEVAISAELGHTFQGRKLAQKSRQEVQHTHQDAHSMDFKVRTTFCWHINRERGATLNTDRTV